MSKVAVFGGLLHLGVLKLANILAVNNKIFFINIQHFPRLIIPGPNGNNFSASPSNDLVVLCSWLLALLNTEFISLLFVSLYSK